MFGNLTDKFKTLFTSLSGKKTLTEENIAEAVREVRLALLDADVNYGVASQFVKRVKEKAIGEQVVKSVSPQQQFIKVVHDSLVELMGNETIPLDLKGTPAVILLCGLQGSGKTTQCAKLAHYLSKKEFNKKVLLAACDLQRPAAIEQLKRLASSIGVPLFSIEGETSPVKVAEQALDRAKKEGFDVLIVDTAGRLHIDETLMKELEKIKQVLSPKEILFVASAMTGQDAVKTAAEFDQRMTITGTILTMLDGNARAGAAISIREVTQKPLKFEGIGEKMTDFQPFHPKSMADRILGMGDVINLVRMAQDHVSEEERARLEKKLMKASFTYEDYLRQMGMIKKMGSFKSLIKMIPGLPDLGGLDIPEKEFGKLEAMIYSMTPHERQGKVELIPRRRRRIADGSGTQISDVDRMVKGFKQLERMMKDMPSMMKMLGGNKENLWR